MSDSILVSTKLALGLAEDYTPFDPMIIMNINSVFADLNQLGIGPEDGFMITGPDELWTTYIDGDLNLNQLQTYMYLRVRQLFDPPTIGRLIQAMDDQIQKMEWRLSVHREMTDYVSPDPEIEQDAILDGGAA